MLYQKIIEGDKKVTKLLGIPIYTKKGLSNHCERKYFGSIYKTKVKDYVKRHYIFGIRLFKTNNKSHFEEHFMRRMLIEEVYSANIVSNVHKQVFPQFKNIHKGGKVVITGAAPSLEYYHPISSAKHIALNRVITFDKIHFDYMFAIDYRGIKDFEDQIINYDCIKFLGKYVDTTKITDMHIPEYLIEKANAYKFYSNSRFYKIDPPIFQDISSAPLMDLYSIAFCALHFAFWTHPSKIYLVGCDCAPTGYFNNEKQNENIEALNQNFSVVIDGYTKVKDFRDSHYPDVELISVNPVGLRGMFRDVYTQSYLDANPDIAKELGDDVEILENLEEMKK